MMFSLRPLFLLLPYPVCGVTAAAAPGPIVESATKGAPLRIDFVHLGGNDCPPCRVWRAVELPKLQAMPEFASMRYTHVTKSIKSTVPSAFFFPAEIKELQPALMQASNGWVGSPQQAILVDGKVVDYWYRSSGGKGDAQAVAAMVRAIREGTPLPRLGSSAFFTSGLGYWDTLGSALVRLVGVGVCVEVHSALIIPLASGEYQAFFSDAYAFRNLDHTTKSQLVSVL